jgi:hypothetical protein
MMNGSLGQQQQHQQQQQQQQHQQHQQQQQQQQQQQTNPYQGVGLSAATTATAQPANMNLLALQHLLSACNGAQSLGLGNGLAGKHYFFILKCFYG